MEQKRILIAVTVLLILSAGLYYSISYHTENEEEFFSVEDASLVNSDESNFEKDDKASLEADVGEICVYICGHVKQAGVYYLAENCRVSDAVLAAGGFEKEAAKEQVNLAKKLEDGEKVYIPSKKESKESIPNQEDFPVEEKAKVNINEAGETSLMSLPGIGKSKADAIVRYRTEHGSFKKVEEIKQIEGIKDGVFEKIKDLITI